MANNVSTVYRYLRTKEHLTPAQASGVIGVMQGESGQGLDPGAVNRSSGATGIAQWLGGRKNAAVMSKRLGPQLAHLSQELHGSERGALQKLRGAHSIDQAVNAWLFGFERPGPNEANLPARTANARRVFSSQSNKPIGSTNTPDLSGGGTSRSNGTTGPAINIGGGTSTVEDPAAKGRVMLANLIQSRDPNSLLLKLGILSPNEPTTKTVTDPGVTIPGASNPSSSSSGSARTASVGRGRGVSKITGPNPGRVIPAVTNFMKEISAVRGGKPVVGSDGTGHSYLTVNGNVSEHSTGHASDIPAKGSELINLGQAALIAAGMPRAKARQQRGGLYNVYKGKRRYQIIFNTQDGGDHTDHLHVGVKG